MTSLADVNPTVSIVMPTLNQRTFIAEAVRSVFAQSGVGALELVVVDGGSSDGTLPELAALAAQFAGRLRWVSAPDSGPAQAVNRAVAMARGGVIGWLNSDDLYTPGALERALGVLAAMPGGVMVYGEGEHVDSGGATLGRYPTRPPSTPFSAFAQGCFVCQPTAFFRREAFDALGGLDESLGAAFDFDLWLRMFKAFPGRIGFVPDVLARSRLHAGGITLRQRERVALEGMAVIRRHLGPAQPDWLLTHFAERCASHPFEATPTDLNLEFERLVNAARGSMSEDGERVLRERLAADRSLLLATSHLYAPIYPDGWAPPMLELRLRQPATPGTTLCLQGRHARPDGGPMQLSVLAPDGSVQTFHLPRNGSFELLIPVADRRSHARLIFCIASDSNFVPAECEPGSADTRRLAYMVEALELR